MTIILSTSITFRISSASSFEKGKESYLSQRNCSHSRKRLNAMLKDFSFLANQGGKKCCQILPTRTLDSSRLNSKTELVLFDGPRPSYSNSLAFVLSSIRCRLCTLWVAQQKSSLKSLVGPNTPRRGTHNIPSEAQFTD
jgi:hypothetical protein